MKYDAPIAQSLVDEAERFYASVYLRHGNQRGGALPWVFVQKPRGQIGQGWFGTAMKGLWRILKPVVMAGGESVARHAVGSAASYIDDVSSGANWQESGKRHLKTFGSNVKASFGAGRKRRKKTKGRKANKRTLQSGRLFSTISPAVTTGRDLREVRKVLKNLPNRSRKRSYSEASAKWL